MSKDWWKSGFFDEHMYAILFPERRWDEARLDAEFIANEIPGEAKDTKILDLCCGPGRHALELADMGYDVTGVDLTEKYLEKAWKLADRRGLTVRFIREDMKNISFDGEFHAVLNLFTSLGYFDRPEDNYSVVENIERALKPGGVFIMDTINRDWLLINFRSSDWSEMEDGSLFLEERTFDPLTDRMENRWIRLWGDRRKSYSFRHYIYNLSKLREMMESAGMKVLNYYGDLRGGEFDRDSRRIAIVAQKDWK